MKVHNFLTCLAVLVTFLSSTVVRAVEPWFDNFSLQVTFSNCSESIGVALAPTPNVESLLPPGYIAVGTGGPVTPVVVRTAHSDISIFGKKLTDRSVVQVGAVIVPPDGTGDINNYTLFYYTDDLRLAFALHAMGINAQFVPTLQYQFPSATSLHVRVPQPGSPTFKLQGSIIKSTVPVGSFLANWWQETDCGAVKMSTNVPDISIGSANLALTTNARGALGALFGTGLVDFPILQQFNLFDSATMQVSSTSP